MSDIRFWIAFNRIPRLGPARFSKMERHFGSMEKAWRAPSSEFKAAGLDRATVTAIQTKRPSIDPDDEMEQMEKLNVRAINWNGDEYPPRLKEIYDPPPVLYVSGSILPEDERSVAVVGTRKATAYGREVTYRLVSDLARNQITIVSGLARGIDGIAHRATLEGGGRTIAVLGSGVNVIYPREHTDLAQQISERGAVISEFPIGTRPDARNFPRRNRIMSGMTLGTLVVEAGEASGALWTVRHALEQDREVFALPGSIFSPASRGSNRIIQEGAKLVIDYNDILEELNLSAVGQQMEMKALFPKDDTESLLLRYITYEPIHIDDVIRNAGLPIATASGALAMMEVKGLIRQVGGMNYVRLKETVAEYETPA